MKAVSSLFKLSVFQCNCQRHSSIKFKDEPQSVNGMNRIKCILGMKSGNRPVKVLKWPPAVRHKVHLHISFSVRRKGRRTEGERKGSAKLLKANMPLFKLSFTLKI